MQKIIQGALTANAASLGLNWIYNIPYLDRLSKEQDLTFTEVDPKKYKRARKAYMAYPNAKVGDVSLQGELLKWLYEALKENPDLTRDEFENLLYDKIKPGGVYEGWVESYGKKIILNHLNKELEIDTEPLSINDDQLVGFIPYIACKALNLSNEKAFELANVFTEDETYKSFYNVFDQLIEDAQATTLKEALKASLTNVPKDFGFKLTMALNTQTPKDILNIVNTSCSIGYALPLMYTIMHSTSSYEEAVRLNTQFGGASSDRGTLMGALLSTVYDINNEWIELTNL